MSIRQVLNNSLLLLLLILAGLSCSSPSTNTASEHDRKQENKIDTHYIVITQMSFSPGTVSVKKGDRLVFVNHDIVAHNIAEATKKAWISPVLKPEDSWMLEVTDTADYYCTLHPVMKGKIALH